MKMTRRVVTTGIVAAALLAGGAVAAQAAGTGDEGPGGYPMNARGETYGSLEDASAPDVEPDLILAEAADGTRGYVRSEDLAPPLPRSPQDEEWSSAPAPRTIPLYATDGIKVIGELTINPTPVEVTETEGSRTEVHIADPGR